MNSCRISSLLLVLLAGAAQADTLYKCADSAGHTTYTNQKTPGKTCTVLSQDKPISTFAAPKVRANAPTPEGFPRVNSETQKNRDNDRRRILEGEMRAEQQKLEDAKKALAEQEAIRMGGEKNYQRVLDRLKPYQDEVQLHERNVESLQKEIDSQR
ncbi:MAG: DUF4124 domain-containing protein [Rhodocyclales bacterium]|nr:DUF4124 domain-containing protein [Rhodocyclales bacterium]